MSETAAARLRRILLLIPHLADGDEHAVDDLARAIGTDRDTLVRDIETLVTRADDPGGFVPGVQIYFTGDRVSLTSTPFRRPMRLTASELGALELGLAMGDQWCAGPIAKGTGGNPVGRRCCGESRGVAAKRR
jgi:predicted DNA-binding transcriptional regulator YafY